MRGLIAAVVVAGASLGMTACTEDQFNEFIVPGFMRTGRPVASTAHALALGYQVGNDGETTPWAP